MTEYEAKMLALLDQGEKDAAVALEDLKALWAREDGITAANRQAMLDAHERGARDRDEVRRRYAGVVDGPAEGASPEPVGDPDTPSRLSDLPVTPLAVLGQSEEG